MIKSKRIYQIYYLLLSRLCIKNRNMRSIIHSGKRSFGNHVIIIDDVPRNSSEETTDEKK